MDSPIAHLERETGGTWYGLIEEKEADFTIFEDYHLFGIWV